MQIEITFSVQLVCPVHCVCVGLLGGQWGGVGCWEESGEGWVAGRRVGRG